MSRYGAAWEEFREERIEFERRIDALRVKVRGLETELGATRADLAAVRAELATAKREGGDR